MVSYCEQIPCHAPRGHVLFVSHVTPWYDVAESHVTLWRTGLVESHVMLSFGESSGPQVKQAASLLQEVP